MAHDALQCGFCTPGFVVEASAFHDRWRAARVPRRPRARRSPPLCRDISAAAAPMRAFFARSRTPAPAASTARAGRAASGSPRQGDGTAHYTVDIRHDGQLEGVILRSPVPHAKITGLELAAARAVPGVAAVVSLLPDEDRWCALSGRRLPRSRQRTRDSARAAIAAITFAHEPLPSVIGLDAARGPTRRSCSTRRNRKRPGNLSEGGGAPGIVERQCARAHRAVLAEGQEGAGPGSRTRARRAIRCSWKARSASRPSSTPASNRMRRWRASTAISSRSIFRRRPSTTSWARSPSALSSRTGRFASSPTISAAASAPRAPLGGDDRRDRACTRRESAGARRLRPRGGTLRHRLSSGGRDEFSLLPSTDGGLKALSLHAHADTGAAVNSLIAGLARLIYPAEAKDLVDFDVVSNLPPGAPFRGPGGPPMSFALEQAIDEAALRMQVDPIALRKRWDPDPNRQRLYDWAMGLEAWRNRKPAARRTAAIAAVSASRPATGCICGRQDPRSSLRSRAAASSQAARCRISVPAPAACSPIRSRRPSTWSRRTSKSASAIRTCLRTGLRRQPRHRLRGAADAARNRKAEGRNPANRGAAADAGSNAPWRELIAASPDLKVSAKRPKDARASSGLRSPLRDVGFMGLVFSWVLRL